MSDSNRRLRGFKPRVSIRWTNRACAAGVGFEPTQRGPKPLVLPLDDPALPTLPLMDSNHDCPVQSRVSCH